MLRLARQLPERNDPERERGRDLREHHREDRGAQPAEACLMWSLLQRIT